MRLAVLTFLVMIAFAANSLLNRMALAEAAAGPGVFAVLRLGTGALALVALARLLGQPLALTSPKRPWMAAALVVYILGFSFSYLTLDAGIGALILFGVVQITMFAGALMMGERPPAARWAGMGLGILGLVWLLWPGGGDGGETRIDLPGALLMTAAGGGWGVYSLLGRGARAPLGETAGSFLLAWPVAAAVWIGSGEGWEVTPVGWGLAALSGVVTSGLGYALWYAVLPRLESAVAGLAQLSVPVIAVIGGALLLGEAVSLQAALAGGMVLAGVAIGVVAGRKGRR